MFKVNYRNTRTRCKIGSKLTFNNFTPYSSVSIVNLEQLNAGWVTIRNLWYSNNMAVAKGTFGAKWVFFHM